MAKSFLVIKNQKESRAVYDLLCENGYVAGENLFIAEKLEDMKSSDFDKYVENHSYLVGNHGYDAFICVHNISHIYSKNAVGKLCSQHSLQKRKSAIISYTHDSQSKELVKMYNIHIKKILYVYAFFVCLVSY